MNTYDVHYRSGLQWGTREIVAEDAARALELARQFAENYPECLDLGHDERVGVGINEIKICDTEQNRLAIWQGED